METSRWIDAQMQQNNLRARKLCWFSKIEVDHFSLNLKKTQMCGLKLRYISNILRSKGESSEHQHKP